MTFICEYKMKAFKSIIIAVILLVIVYLFTVKEVYDVNESYVHPSSHPTRYKTLGNQYTNPLFSPCLASRCSGGPYMMTGNPYLQQVCESVPNADLAQLACGKAFRGGRPVQFDYTPLSDWQWTNERCQPPSLSSSALCPLGC